MFSSKSAWLIPVTLSIVSFGANVESAKAQSLYETYTFSADYNTLVTIDPSFRPDLDIVRATITGESTKPAPYGLDFFVSNTYGKLEIKTPILEKYNFNSDPSVFGLNDQPILSDRYYGGDNELFGTASDSAEINFLAGTIKGGGTITISGGTGLFKNATGTITFTQEDKLSPPGTPSQGLAKLTFNIKTAKPVPEPSATTPLFGLCVIGTGLLLRRRRNKISFKS